MKKKELKVGIIGHFGGKEDILDGQTIKTKILYSELVKATDWKISVVDTYYKNRKPFKLLIDSLICLLKEKHILVLLSGNGMKFYFPILTFFSKYFNKHIYHDVIGGNLDKYVEENSKFSKYLNQFDVNWVETDSMKKRLERLGINNCEVMPNFKRLNIIDIEPKSFSQPYEFCIFSRVMKEKGIEDAINAILDINKDYGNSYCKLDIFGKVDDSYKERFEELMKNVPESISYKGMVPYDQSVDTIKNYYALLFPTYWKGEGFPGTIIDAFASGLPVIATDWSCNSEIVTSYSNGILYPNETVANLREAICFMINQNERIIHYKYSCVATAKNYMPDSYIESIIDRLSC